MRCLSGGMWLAAVGLLVAPVLAQPPGGPGERGGPGGPNLRQRVVAAFDADGDGVLNEEERQAAMEFMRDRPGRGERLGRGRPDGDRPATGRRGADAERGPEGRPARRAERPAGPGGPPRARLAALFEWFDADGDGALSRAEFGELATFVQGRWAARGDRPRLGLRGPGDGPRRGEPGDRPERPRLERRGLGVDGPPWGDAPGRRGREGRGPRGAGPPRPDGPDEPATAEVDPDEPI